LLILNTSGCAASRICDSTRLSGGGRGFFVVRGDGRGHPAQHQQNGPLPIVAAAKHWYRVRRELMIDEILSGLKFSEVK